MNKFILFLDLYNDFEKLMVMNPELSGKQALHTHTTMSRISTHHPVNETSQSTKTFVAKQKD